jgi:hypothetical protein
MNHFKIKFLAVVCSCSLLTGCGTTDKNLALLGTLVCAGAGIGTAIATGHAGLGAAAGVGCEALVIGGIALYNYQTKQVRTAQQDQQLYGYAAPVDTAKVKIRDIALSSTQVKPGDTIKINLEYSVMTPSGVNQADVIESATVKKYTVIKKKKGKSEVTEETLKNLGEQTLTRPAGGSNAQFDFSVPKTAPGTYLIEYTVKTGNSYDVRSAKFVVGS